MTNVSKESWNYAKRRSNKDTINIKASSLSDITNESLVKTIEFKSGQFESFKTN